MAKKSATFAGAMAKAPKKAWEEARKVEAGGSANRELPEIEDGVYPCRMKKMRCGASDKGPYVSITLVVLEGEYEGTVLDKFHMISDWGEDLKRLVKTLKGAGYEFPDDIDNAKAGKLIEDIAADVNSEQPEVLVSVKNGTYVAKKDTDEYKKGDEVPKLDIYINRPRSVEEGANVEKKPAKKPAKKPTRK